jgi:Uma2 family endonuclease
MIAMPEPITSERLIIPMTVEEFDAYILAPENRQRRFEYIGGELMEMTSNSRSSETAHMINGFLFIYRRSHDIGHYTGSDGGYIVMGERYIPDTAFISYSKRPKGEHVDGYAPHAPDLAVEVISPGNTEEEMSIKIANYLAAGTLVWRFEPLKKRVTVFAPGEAARVLDMQDVLDGGTVLPGFQVNVKDVFPE